MLYHLGTLSWKQFPYIFQCKICKILYQMYWVWWYDSLYHRVTAHNLWPEVKYHKLWAYITRRMWSSDWCHLNYYVLCHLRTLFCKDGSSFMYSYIRFTKCDTKTKCHASGDMTRVITVTAHNSWPSVKRNKMSYHHTNGDAEFILMPYAVVHALPIITISISWNIDLEMAHQGMQMKF